MKTFIPLIAAFALAGSISAQAQTTTMPPASTSPPPAVSAPAKAVILTDEQAKTWINKPVYSSDNKNLGEVAAFARDSTGKVVELHADVGGFLGIGEHRVRLLPVEFSLGNDRIVLNMTADQAKSLPRIPK